MMKKAVFQPKSLFLSCQETLSKNLDALHQVGHVPYEFLEFSLRHATPEQLQRIEMCNPKIKRQSNDLWLSHCLLFPDIKDEYNKMGSHREPKKWRSLYRRRYEENELKKESVKQKIREKYNIINNEKAAKSIKVIKGMVPRKGRTFEDTRRANMSPLFHKSRKETSKVASIYNTSQRRPPPSRPAPAPQSKAISRPAPQPKSISRTAPQPKAVSRPAPLFPPPSRPNPIQQQPKKPALITSRSVPNRLPSNHTPQITHVPARPAPAQYLRQLPMPQKQPIQAPTPPSSHPERYQPFHSPPISPPFSPPRSHSPEARPHKKPKMYF